MANEDEGNELDLFKQPGQYSFYQTVSFLRRLHREATGDGESEEDFLRKRLRVNSHLSLAFPPNDVVGLKVLPPQDSGKLPAPPGETVLPTFAEGERIEVTATFMGLYGSASPLPTFYTEELLDDYRNDLSTAKSFLDLVGQLFFIRYFQALSKYRLLDRVVREESRDVRNELFCLFGTGHPELLGSRQLSDRDLACAGLFSLNRRPASALRSYLATRFNLDYEQAEIEQCLADWVDVPADQRALLGSSSVALGEDAVLGRKVPDRMGSFRVHLRNLDAETYHQFLPGREGWDDLLWAIKFYAGSALRSEVRLYLKSDETQTSRINGNRWAELGGDAFLGIGETGTGERETTADFAGCGYS